MPKGVRIPDIVKDDIRRDYYERCCTVGEIAAKYGVHRRRVYDYVKADRHQCSYATGKRRKMTYLSKDDVELILLMLLECNGILTGRNKDLAKCLEEKMLNMADDLTFPD